MWVVLVGGVVGIVTLLVQFALNAGSKESRQRASIAADIGLWQSVPADFDGRGELQKQIEARLSEYTRSPDVARAPAIEELLARDTRETRGVSFAITLTATGLATGIALVVRETAHVKPMPVDWVSVSITVALGIAIVIIVGRELFRFNRRADKEIEQLEATFMRRLAQLRRDDA